MRKRLMLMRHADSPQLMGCVDFERSLSEYGIRQALATGAYLLSKGWVPDVILVSMAQRTMHTAQLVAAAAKVEAERIFPVRALYNAHPRKISDVMNQANMLENAASLLIIAHNPGVSQLAMECCGETKAMYFSPAAVAGFEMDENIDWRQLSSDDAGFSFYYEPQL